MSYRRFVALGDSTTEGLMDPLPDGSGFRGWADRLAEMLAAAEPDLLYANLAVRGKLARQVRETHLEPALALRPDLVSVLAGLNDMLRRNVDVAAVIGELDGMVARLRGARADVLLFTLPAPVPLNPLAKPAAARVARLNDAIREISARRGTFLVELDRHAVSADHRLWSEDRLHDTAEGHRRTTAAAAHAIGLPDTDMSWTATFPSPLGRRSRRSHAGWFGRYFTPWLIRRVGGRSSGDGRVAKRPQLQPLRDPEGSRVRG